MNRRSLRIVGPVLGCLVATDIVIVLAASTPPVAGADVDAAEELAERYAPLMEHGQVR